MSLEYLQDIIDTLLPVHEKEGERDHISYRETASAAMNMLLAGLIGERATVLAHLSTQALRSTYAC